MTDQPRLPFGDLELPASWDGLEVAWRGWSSYHVFVCPPPKPKDAACQRCGSLAQPSHNSGVVHPPAADASFETLAALYQAGTLADTPTPLVWLHAFRCPDCQLDTVWDQRTDEWWVLDASDYGPQGSTDPRLF